MLSFKYKEEKLKSIRRNEKYQMKHSRSKNAVLLMIIFICSICSNNVWARETGTMDQLEKENLDDVDKMNKGRVKKREFFHASFCLWM